MSTYQAPPALGSGSATASTVLYSDIDSSSFSSDNESFHNEEYINNGSDIHSSDDTSTNSCNASLSIMDTSSNNSEYESYTTDSSDNKFSYIQSSDDTSNSTILYSRDTSVSNINDIQLEGDSLKLWYSNADSYLNKRKEMLVEVELQNPDSIVISGLFPKTVKATDINLVEFSIDGFSLFLSKIEEKSRDVGIYVKDSLSCIECSVLDNRTFKESCWCEIVLKNNEKYCLVLYIGAHLVE